MPHDVQIPNFFEMSEKLRKVTKICAHHNLFSQSDQSAKTFEINPMSVPPNVCIYWK